MYLLFIFVGVVLIHQRFHKRLFLEEYAKVRSKQWQWFHERNSLLLEVVVVLRRPFVEEIEGDGDEVQKQSHLNSSANKFHNTLIRFASVPPAFVLSIILSQLKLIATPT